MITHPYTKATASAENVDELISMLENVQQEQRLLRTTELLCRIELGRHADDDGEAVGFRRRAKVTFPKPTFDSGGLRKLADKYPDVIRPSTYRVNAKASLPDEVAALRRESTNAPTVKVLD